MLLIGKASPQVLFAEEKAGYQRKDQLTVDECNLGDLAKPPLEQFIEGYYCDPCGLGFVSDEIRRANHT